MSKYIDAEKLKARIDELGDVLNDPICQRDALGPDWVCGGKVMLKKIRSSIETLQQDQPKYKKDCNDCPHCVDRKDQFGWHFKGCFGGPYNGKFIAEIDVCPLKQEQPEVDLDKFTEKIKTFQARYKHPEIVSIKGAMAFMARMFYQYPNAAKQWYDSLPKATMN